MSTDALANAIKKLAVNANDATKPDKIITGRVIDTLRDNPDFNPDVPSGPDNPKYIGKLTIQINDKFILSQGDKFLEITKYMKEKIASARYVKLNDTVILLRIENGRKYILLDVI